ncbi:GNAT family N-acetyltransferase [Dactylosporangium sp. CA-233914]|uniref:GNAT family N-acetyltransferase n=1 Tax=Dactylosporangium sp. CA-233914 TaxID=3239934 RepID=UPI003D9197EF
MDGYHARACGFGDAAAIAGLINVVAEAGGGRGGYLAAEVEDVLRNEVRDLAADTLAVAGPGGELAGVALVPLPPAGGDRVELIGGVHPEHRGAGIGRALLAWQLERAAARHREVASETPWSGQVIAGAGDATAIRLFERSGFSVARHFLEMTAPTEPAPAVAAVPGLRIVPLRQEQTLQLYRAHAAAFQGLWGYQERTLEDWAALTVRSEAFRPELARVAMDGEAIAGYVLPYGEPGEDRLYIGQVGTAEAWRRRGVATALLAEVMREAARAGYTRAALDVDADNPADAAATYAKAGFTPDHRVVVYRRSV